MDVNTIKKDLLDIMKQYGLKNESQLVITESIKEWAEKRGIKERDPLRIAMKTTERTEKVDKETGKKELIQEEPIIILKKEVSEPELQSPRSRALHISLELNGVDMESAKKMLESDENFIKFCLLHEIAHIKGFASEEEADFWAYKELPKVI